MGMKNATINIQSNTIARGVAWKSPRMKAPAFNYFHLTCYTEWRKHTTIEKHIKRVWTIRNPSIGTACAFCRKEV